MREEEVRRRQREGQSCYETKSESHLFTMYTPSMGMAMDTTHHSPLTPLTTHGPCSTLNTFFLDVVVDHNIHVATLHSTLNMYDV